MLLSFLATLIPINIFHDHKQYSHCNHADVTVENNPCHISAYHVQSKKHTCGHKYHLTNAQDTCKFCKVLIPKRYQNPVINDFQSKIIPIHVSQNILVGNETFILLNLCSSILGRAPPVS